MTDRMDDLEAVAALVQMYVDGAARADVELLREAFLESARMYGYEKNVHVDVPIQDFFDEVASLPVPGPGFRSHVVSIDVVGRGRGRARRGRLPRDELRQLLLARQAGGPMEDREQDVRDDRVGGLAVELEVCANPDNRIPIRIKPSAPAVHRAPPSIYASNRTTRRRATGCIVRKSMMSAQS